ncbi:MAG: hypothetical protein ACYTF7_11920 [Planctomycetota bacterium]|jgi:hypothetical protein
MRTVTYVTSFTAGPLKGILIERELSAPDLFHAERYVLQLTIDAERGKVIEPCSGYGSAPSPYRIVPGTVHVTDVSDEYASRLYEWIDANIACDRAQRQGIEQAKEAGETLWIARHALLEAHASA